MEHIEIKTEKDLYEEFENSQENVETSEHLFGNPYYQQSIDEDEDFDDSEDYVPNFSNTALSQDEKQRATWLDKDCQLLIALYKEEHPNVGKSFVVKTKRKLWERIAKRMHEQGSCFSAPQIEGKWKSLKRAYNNSLIGRKKGKRKSCPYEKDISEMLGHPSNSPIYELRRREESDKAEETLFTDNGISLTEEQSPTLSIGSESLPLEDDASMDSLGEPSRRSKKSTTILEELQMWREEFIRERKAKKKYRYAKLRAYKKRTAILEKQTKYKQELLLAFGKSQNTNSRK